MRCPTCDIDLNIEPTPSQTVHRCSNCNGQWLDEGDLGVAIRQVELPDVQPPSSKLSLQGLNCPSCNRPMQPFNYAYDSGVMISKCEHCAGLWLQSGQLEQIARYRAGTPATRSLENAMIDEMRVASRWRLARQMLRSTQLAIAVSAIEMLAVVFSKSPVQPLRPMSAAEIIVKIAIWLLVPIFIIYYADALGEYQPSRNRSIFSRSPVITASTPGDFVALGGWLLLLCPMIVLGVKLLSR